MAFRMSTLLALALPAVATASSTPIHDVVSSLSDSIQSPGFVSFPIKHRATKSLSARDATASLVNEDETSYLIELTFGSNAQSVKVAIDTGSNELFVNPNCTDADFALSIQKECLADGQYDPDTSTTSDLTGEQTEIVYGSGAVVLEYVIDSIGIPGTGTNLSKVQFGIATTSEDLNEGILGLGFGEGYNLNYSNFVDQLASQKVTNTKAFSIALGNSETAGGNIIFGGVDTKKFSGSLASSDIQDPAKGDIQRYSVQLNSIAFTNSSASTKYDDSDLSVVLDTGSSLCELPTAIVSAMADDFGAVEDDSGLLYVDCAYQDVDGSLDFAFEGVTISVPFKDFILPDGTECVLGVQAFDPSSGITALLGDTFFRSAYVVFDQTNMKISLAQYVNCGTNEQAIPTGKNGVSSFKGECGSNSTSSSSGDDGSDGDSSKSAGDMTRPVAATSIVGFVAALAALLALF